MAEFEKTIEEIAKRTEAIQKEMKNLVNREEFNKFKDSIEDRTASLEKSTASIEKRTASIQDRTASLEKSTASIEKRTASIQDRTASLEKSTASIEKRTTSIEQRTTSIEKQVAAIAVETVGLKERTENLVSRDQFNAFKDDLYTRQDEMMAILTRLDQERVFTTRAIDRLEEMVEKNRAQIEEIKLKLNLP